jgi:hypothetical protein
MRVSIVPLKGENDGRKRREKKKNYASDDLST